MLKSPTGGQGDLGDDARRIRFERAFKFEAIRIWKTSRRSARKVAEQLGISAPTLYAWGRELRNGADEQAPKLYLRDLEKEIIRLNEENRRLQQHCEILKKTLRILAEPAVDVSVTT